MEFFFRWLVRYLVGSAVDHGVPLDDDSDFFTCPVCKWTIRPDGPYCTHCSSDISVELGPWLRRRRMRIAMYAVGLVLAIGAGFWFYYSRRG